jgi:hypothetical protein
VEIPEWSRIATKKNLKKIMKNTESPEGSEKFGEKTEHGFSMMKKKVLCSAQVVKPHPSKTSLLKGAILSDWSLLRSTTTQKLTNMHVKLCQRDKMVSATYSSI